MTMLLQFKGSWELLDAGLHGDVSLHGRCHSPKEGFHSKQENVPHQTTDTTQKWFEGHDKEPEVLTWPQNSSYPNPIEQLCDPTPPTTEQEPKDLQPKSQCQVPQDALRGPLSMSR